MCSESNRRRRIFFQQKTAEKRRHRFETQTRCENKQLNLYSRFRWMPSLFSRAFNVYLKYASLKQMGARGFAWYDSRNCLFCALALFYALVMYNASPLLELLHQLNWPGLSELNCKTMANCWYCWNWIPYAGTRISWCATLIPHKWPQRAFYGDLVM